MGARRGPLVAADGAVPVSPGAVLLEEMLARWRRQQPARRLTARRHELTRSRPCANSTGPALA